MIASNAGALEVHVKKKKTQKRFTPVGDSLCKLQMRRDGRQFVSFGTDGEYTWQDHLDRKVEPWDNNGVFLVDLEPDPEGLVTRKDSRKGRWLSTPISDSRATSRRPSGREARVSIVADSSW